MKELKELTKAEEKVMQILWDLEKGVIRDILAKFDEPKPSYTTVATVLKVLEKKGFVKHKKYAHVLEYQPIIMKEAYSEFALDSIKARFFNNSLKRLVSFFVEKENIDIQELEELSKIIQQKKQDNEGNNLS